MRQYAWIHFWAVLSLARGFVLPPSPTTPTRLWATIAENNELTEKQLDFTLGYLNKHHKDVLAEFAKAFSDVGTAMAKANAFSGGSFVIESSKIVSIDTDSLELKVSIDRRGKKLHSELRKEHCK